MGGEVARREDAGAAAWTEEGEPRTPLQEAMRQFFLASALMEPLRLRIWDLEGLTVTQLRLLMYVAQSEGMSNAELADRLYVTRPSVSALLERLERGGFLRREISPNDRRGICIRLEDRGRAVCDNLSLEVREYVGGLMEGLSDKDLDDLSAALAKMVEAGRRRRERDLSASAQEGHPEARRAPYAAPELPELAGAAE